jgi:hypothetical protein
MNLKQDARDIVTTLEDSGFYAECPCCGEPIRLKDAGLFYLTSFRKPLPGRTNSTLMN